MQLSLQWLKTRRTYPFLIGIFCALLGIATTFFLFSKTFPGSVGLVSVFFTSFALFPFWDRILSIRGFLVGTERKTLRGKDVELTEMSVVSRKQQLNPLHQLRSHRDLFGAYIFSFLGVFVVFAILQLLLPPVQAETLFAEQTSILQVSAADYGLAGEAFSILRNNIFVLIICFLISLVYRSGIFVLVWNASVWGVVFGMVVRETAFFCGGNAWILAGIAILIMLPHLVLEAFAYLAAAVSGGLAFQAMWKKLQAMHFSQLITDTVIIMLLAAIFLVIGAIVEAYFAIPLMSEVLLCQLF